MRKSVKINEEKLQKYIAESIERCLMPYKVKKQINESKAKVTDDGKETSKTKKDRAQIESYFKQDGINTAQFAYKLFGVKPVEGKDTNEMKNARSLFMKKLNHEKNTSGFSYKFTKSETTTLKNMISSTELSESIRRTIKESFQNEFDEAMETIEAMYHGIENGNFDCLTPDQEEELREKVEFLKNNCESGDSMTSDYIEIGEKILKNYCC